MTQQYELDHAIVIPSGDDPGTFLYAPKTPRIALDANGRHQLNLLSAGAVAFLQVTGAWGLNGAEVEEVREQLARKLGVQASTLRLQPLADSVDGAALLLGDGEGELRVLQESKSSGVPPFHAAFNVMLDETQLQTVRKALDGNHRLLALRYDITRRRPATTIDASYESIRTLSANTESQSTRARTKRETNDHLSTWSVQLDAADWPRGQ